MINRRKFIKTVGALFGGAFLPKVTAAPLVESVTIPGDISTVCDSFTVVIGGGRSGKTYAIAEEFCLHWAEKRKEIILDAVTNGQCFPEEKCHDLN